MLFQHTAARRRLDQPFNIVSSYDCVSTHSRPKAAGKTTPFDSAVFYVSTHSRPKAAGWKIRLTIKMVLGFNTQPPEGGWFIMNKLTTRFNAFQHTAARRRLVQHWL